MNVSKHAVKIWDHFKKINKLKGRRM